MSGNHLERRIDAAIRAALPDAGGIGLGLACAMAAASEEEARRIGVPVVVSIVDAGGLAVLLHRMDGALPASVRVAADKAFTAAMFRLPTDALGRVAQPGGELYGIATSQDGRVVLFGGGMPLLRCGICIGAIGVSGGSTRQDIRIAECGMSMFF